MKLTSNNIERMKALMDEATQLSKNLRTMKQKNNDLERANFKLSAEMQDKESELKELQNTYRASIVKLGQSTLTMKTKQ
jgi:SMC interacting uncharacterized protein involved in chromosome segregation